MAKPKFSKRKRMFNLFTEEGRELHTMHMKFLEVFPDEQERLNYIKALIADFDKSLNAQCSTAL